MKWKPKEDERYFYIIVNRFHGTNILDSTWSNTGSDRILRRSSNIFRTRKEAQAKLKQIKQILKG